MQAHRLASEAEQCTRKIKVPASALVGQANAAPSQHESLSAQENRPVTLWYRKGTSRDAEVTIELTCIAAPINPAPDASAP